MKTLALLAALGLLGLAFLLTMSSSADPVEPVVPVAEAAVNDHLLRPAQTDYTVNGVLGDESFVAAFGRRPGLGDAEDLRLRTHLAYVEHVLRARDVGHLTPALREARARNLDRLHEYWTAGVFPRNTVVPDRRTPVFIDEAGRICAVGYLLEQDLGREAAQAVNARYRTATIFEIDDPALAAWLATSGLTEREAAMIQPAYGPAGEFIYRFDTAGPTVCGSNENPTPEIFFSHPAVTASDIQRTAGVSCDDSVDDVFGSSGFSATYDPDRSIRFETMYAGTVESPYYSLIELTFWRDAAGPTQVRLLASVDGGATFIQVGEYDVTTTPNEEFAFVSFFPEPPPGADVIYAIEAQGGDPAGVLYLEDVFDGTYFTPVELTAFTARLDGSTVRLDWATASETNNAGFEVQMRRDGEEPYEALGFVEGYGTTTEAQVYSFSATGLEPGAYAFRLKQVDFDGQFEYHGAVEVTVVVPETFVLTDAYPNPFNPQARFTLAVAETQPVRVSVYDALGRRVADLFDGVLDGGRAHPFTLDGSGLASGLHVVRVIGASFTASQMVTLVR